MDLHERFLQHRLAEELLWIKLHADVHATEADAMAYLRSQCGLSADGCRYAGSDYCAVDCPFRQEDL